MYCFYYDHYSLSLNLDIPIVSDSLFGKWREYRTPMYSFLLEYSKGIYRIRSPTRR